MRPLPAAVLDIIATLPDDKPCKIVINTNGQGHWDVELFERHVIIEEVPPCPLPYIPVRTSRLKPSRQRL